MASIFLVGRLFGGGVNSQGVFIRLTKDGEGDGCGAGRVIINLDVGHDDAVGGGEGEKDNAEGEEKDGDEGAEIEFHFGTSFLWQKPIQFICSAIFSAAGMKNALDNSIKGVVWVRPAAGRNGIPKERGYNLAGKIESSETCIPLPALGFRLRTLSGVLWVPLADRSIIHKQLSKYPSFAMYCFGYAKRGCLWFWPTRKRPNREG